MRNFKEKTEKTIARRFKEGRGSGTGKDYKPFITVRDIPSKGRVHRVPSVTVGRIHHVMSDLERDIFYWLDWKQSVRDIREQFPIPLEATKEISVRLEIAHPEIRGVDQIMTTDFLIDIYAPGKSRTLALSAKYVEHLEDIRVIEKLEIERCYWKENGISFHIVTEEAIPKLLKENIEWIHPCLKNYEFSEIEQQENFEIFCHALENYSKHKVTAITSRLDEDFNTDPGHHLKVLRHLLAQRAFSFDMENKSIKQLVGNDVSPSKHWLSRSYEYVIGE